MLGHRAEEPLVQIHCGRHVVDGVPDMMDAAGAHCAPILGDGYPQGAPMGFLDKIKQQATDVASTVAEKTQETAKVGQMQMQLRSLKGEEKEAFADFGRQAYGLHRDGALAERSGELASGAARIADLQSQIAAKEQEIADVKGDEGSETVEGSAEEVAEPAAEASPPPPADAPPPPPPPPPPPAE
jgi:cell division protein FtsB